MNVVFHRRDLRTKDNKALAVAGEDAAPVYIFDPYLWDHELASNSRQQFIIESLMDLNRQYIRLGTELKLLHGNPVEILEDIKNEGHRVLFNKDSNTFCQEKENALREKFNGLSGNAVISKKTGRPDKWANNAKYWFESDMFRPPKTIKKSDIESNISINEICNIYGNESDKKIFGRGGSFEAEKRLENFIENIDHYSAGISSPSKAESSNSHLSPYISLGCISPRQVYQRVRQETGSQNNKISIEMFKDRVFWQQHFNQKIEDNPELFTEAINPVFRNLYKDNANEELISAWKNGLTGYPLVDASMRALVETGWINFRMRAMCASFYSYILKQWWLEGADFFYRHLIDADVAINYYQWQMHSGIIGVHANRIYNPTKQVNENDSRGVFIKKYVPVLNDFPLEYIAEPWKMPEKTQAKYGVIIGEDYPKPIVNYDREARKARKFFKSKAGQAYASFRDDEVWQKASLSYKHKRDEILEKADDGQKDLSAFS